MREHQRYFPVEDQARKNCCPILLAFEMAMNRIWILLKRGNEKVLQARLADARFFFEEDFKRSNR